MLQKAEPVDCTELFINIKNEGLVQPCLKQPKLLEFFSNFDWSNLIYYSENVYCFDVCSAVSLW